MIKFWFSKFIAELAWSALVLVIMFIAIIILAIIKAWRDKD